jgi:hypothetical protein
MADAFPRKRCGFSLSGFSACAVSAGARDAQHRDEKTRLRKESQMKRLRAPATIFGGVAVAAVVVGSALGSSSALVAKYSGTVTEKVDGQQITAVPKGKGTGTLIGKSTLTGVVKATTANPPCSPLNGPGTLTGAKGKLRVTLLSTSRGCAASEDDQNNISFSGSARVNGGTGKFRGAKGTLRFTGHYDRAGGTFNVKLTGTVKY